MPAVTYRIKGKYDNKAVKQAQNGFTALGKSVQNINKLVTGFVGLKVIQQITNFSKKGMEAFEQQNKALSQFNTAVAKSGLNLSKLQSIQDKVSKNNLFDGDTINNAMTMATTLGLNEKQIEDVMQAAIDLDAAGVMPLEQGVKALSQTYNGNLGTLKKIAPELDGLTKKQLQNGAAVESLGKKYAGFGDSLSNTFAGRNTQFANSISDLQAAIGSIPESFKFITEGKLLEPLNKVTKWITDNRNYIINFFLHLPEVATTVFNSIKEMFKNSFENLPELITSIGPLIVQAGKDSFATLVSVAKEAIKGIADLLDWAIGNPFRTSQDFVNKFLNNIIEGINKLADKLPKRIKEWLFDGKDEAIKFRFETDNKNKNKTWEETAKEVSEAIAKASTTYKDGTKKVKEDWLKVLEATTGFYKDDIKELKDKLSEILGKDLPKDLENALNGITGGKYNFGSGKGKTGGGGGGSDGPDLIKTIFSQGGELGALFNAFREGGAVSVIATLIGQIAGPILQSSEIISSLFNTVSYTMNRIMKPILDLLEPIALPILSMTAAIADIVGVFLPVLQPIADFIADVLKDISSLLFMLKTFFTALFDTFKYIETVITNWFIKLYNAIVSKKNEKSEIKNKSWDEIKAEWGILGNSEAFNSAFNSYLNNGLGVSAYTGNASSSSGSASYTAARDVYININYDHSFVNGDVREIALVLRDEIVSAERLGY